MRNKLILFLYFCFVPAESNQLLADTLSFQASDFTLNPSFNNVQTFEFTIDLPVAITVDTAYANPVLNQVDYHVFGQLTEETPSDFSIFNLIRMIEGPEFYSQGSSLSFTVDAAADLSDGLQISDLAGSGTVFTFDGREVGTGRYHPAIVKLNSDGTGSIRNSNNSGGINPVTEMEVNVDFGDEYITEFTFNPALLTLSLTGCAQGQHVSSNLCVACPAGTTNYAGDDATGPDTSCIPILLLEDGFE